MTDKKPPQKPKKPAARKPRAAASDSKKAKPRAEKSPAKTSQPGKSGKGGKSVATPKPQPKSPAPTPKKEAKPRAKKSTSKAVPKYIDDAIARAVARSKGESRIYEFEQVEPFIEEGKRESAAEDFITYLKRRHDEEEAEKTRIEEAKREKLRTDLLESIETERDTGETKARKGKGRPLEFTEAMKVELLVEIMMGKSVARICEDNRFPSRNTVYRHLAADSDFSDRYARAHEVAADDEFDKMHEIIDECPADKGAIMKAREMIAVRKWTLGKKLPDKYGPKSQLTVIGTQRIAPIDDHDGVEEARDKYENARDFDF